MQTRIRPERLSQLGAVFERITTRSAMELGDFFTAPVQLHLGEILIGKAGSFLAKYDGGGAVGVFRGNGNDAPILIGADGNGIDMIIEAGFGADGSEPAENAERPLSKIEARLAASVFQRIIGMVHEASEKKGAPPALDRLECLSDQPALVRREDEWLIARLEFTVLNRSGELFILMPIAAIGAWREAPMETSPAIENRDPRWSGRIQQELTRTDVTLHAILEERELTLGEIASLRPGDMLPLRATPQSRVKLVSNAQPLLWCEFGQAAGAYTLRVQDFISAEQDLIDAILSE
ncbi:MAG TPA: FliM/FliN family flagellar motor switch protein [Paracoccaceae bacterium]|nr:FliM/FliN family flagellar motor switch protein [Paracoccaceae bacterium]